MCLINQCRLESDHALRQGIEDRDLVLVTDMKNWSALHLAAVAENISALFALLQHGVDISAQTAEGHTILHLACALGKRDRVKAISEHRRVTSSCSLMASRDNNFMRAMDLTAAEIRFLYLFQLS